MCLYVPCYSYNHLHPVLPESCTNGWLSYLWASGWGWLPGGNQRAESERGQDVYCPDPSPRLQAGWASLPKGISYYPVASFLRLPLITLSWAICFLLGLWGTQGLGLIYSPTYTWQWAECLAHGRCPINMCWINEYKTTQNQDVLNAFLFPILFVSKKNTILYQTLV